MTTTANTETLEQALRRCYGNATKTLYSQAHLAALAVSDGIGGTWTTEWGLKVQGVLTHEMEEFHDRLKHVPVACVMSRRVEAATAIWYKQGLSPATINKRLNCLSKMGVSVEGLRVKNPKQLKWYLKESDKPAVLAWLKAKPDTVYKVVADLIEWTTLTGLRIEENLRLTWGDLERSADGLPVSVSVPGLKTASSQATLPLSSTAGWVLVRGEYSASKTGRLFNVKYELLAEIWDEVREQFGWKADPTATLKALRRSAARYLHVDCGMPLHMVQQYLRHESMDTTLEYLRLTGGYGTEEMRRFLK